jgi:proteasome lid subunit RPN8/RPN11
MISTDTRAVALAHAIECVPRESCGLVVIVRGKERYWPCQNIAVDDADFRIDSADYLAASQAGSIVGVIHSHPDSFPQPTPADLASCEKWGLPWHIVSPHLDVPHGRWHSFQPSGFRAPLIGREWVWGIHDCWTLVKDWYSDHGIVLPDFERPNDPEDFVKAPLFDSLFPEAGFNEVPRSEAKPGDAVLMSFYSKGLNHVGVLDSNYRLLHHVRGRLSSLDLYGEGLQKATGKIVRHLDYERLNFSQ